MRIKPPNNPAKGAIIIGATTLGQTAARGPVDGRPFAMTRSQGDPAQTEGLVKRGRIDTDSQRFDPLGW
jgi:hypothetical protein